MKIKHLNDIQQGILAPVQWAMNSNHTTMRATPRQLTFNRDMILPTAYLEQWEMMRQQRQAITDRDNYKENQGRINHIYKTGDLIIIKQSTLKWKLARPTKDPLQSD
jgi:hypothetical protein